MCRPTQVPIWCNAIRQKLNVNNSNIEDKNICLIINPNSGTYNTQLLVAKILIPILCISGYKLDIIESSCASNISS